MWLAGFHYVILSTGQVQQIMKDNNEMLNEKINRHTKKLRNQVVRQSASKQRLERLDTEGNEESKGRNDRAMASLQRTETGDNHSIQYNDDYEEIKDSE